MPTLSPPSALEVPACAKVGVEELICGCHAVGEGEIREAIEGKAACTVDELTEHTGAGGSCRSCHCRMQRMLDGESPSCPRFGFCTGCGCIRAICRCNAA